MSDIGKKCGCAECIDGFYNDCLNPANVSESELIPLLCDDKATSITIGDYALKWLDEDHVLVTGPHGWKKQVCGGDLETLFSVLFI